jgi:hypothetical protein
MHRRSMASGVRADAVHAGHAFPGLWTANSRGTILIRIFLELGKGENCIL